MTIQGQYTLRDYEHIISARDHGTRNPVLASDSPTNWKDRPFGFTIYRDCTRVPLAPGFQNNRLGLGVPGSANGPNASQVTLEQLSDLLLLSAGILTRKLTGNSNANGLNIGRQRHVTYSRGTPSGGGLYPAEIYLTTSSRVSLPVGVYHYDPAHHSLDRLRMGRFDALLRDMCDHNDRLSSTAFFVILTARVWKSAFKYHAFAYKVISQDIGAMVGSMELISHSIGWTTTTIYWFDDTSIGTLLTLNMELEQPFIVFAVQGAAPGAKAQEEQDTVSSIISIRDVPTVTTKTYERSRRIAIPDLVRALHKRTLIEDSKCPSSPELDKLIAESSPPKDCAIQGNLISLFRNRETSWGRLRREPSLDLRLLKGVLGFMATGVQYRADIYERASGLPSLRFSLIAPNVGGLDQGLYDYYTPSEVFLRRSGIDRSGLQSILLSTTYNVDQAAAIVIVIGKLERMLGIFGERGARVMNAEAGVAAQRAYIGCTSMGLGCGAVLGFNGRFIGNLLRVDDEGQVPLLVIFMGHQVTRAVAYNFRLY